jgi:hypothetical protein
MGGLYRCRSIYQLSYLRCYLDYNSRQLIKVLRITGEGVWEGFLVAFFQQPETNFY